MSSQTSERTLGAIKVGRVQIFLALMIISLVITAFAFGQIIKLINMEREYWASTSELQVLSQSVAKNASEAAQGTAPAFTLLQEVRSQYEKVWGRIQLGAEGSAMGVDTVFRRSAANEIDELEKLWTGLSSNADKILAGQTKVLDLHDVARNVGEVVASLQEEYEIVVQIMIEQRASSAQVAIAERQIFLAERIIGNINKILEGTEKSVVAADTFGRDANRFGRVLAAMLEGDAAINVRKIQSLEAYDTLLSIADQFLEVSESVDEILEISPELFQVREAANAIFKESTTLLYKLQSLERAFKLIGDETLPLITSIGAFIASVIFLILMLAEFKKQIKTRLDSEARMRLLEEQQNQKNQNAILRLLDELSDLADGDLTIHTTVSEDFTGAIADSINFTIDQLRTLVSTINETAVQVSSAAQETQATAVHLAEASDHQAQEITGASAAVNEMAVSIDQVSANAAESSAVAERSVTIAKKGADVVKATIGGMSTIREQIQETSKRIKRLGESSQEIGDIVSLITDIADQTNILALNAAIQASMAGDAGRGFAVVADEVQRLAERASAATKQIEGLVKTIQTDTSEAVISMEHTTAEVVRGARLAQDGGVALEEIETVSTNLADLIQNISNAAKQQASSAGQISNTMNVIQEITSQTSAGTSATANSTGNLAHLAVQMRNSVAGFKLPDPKAVKAKSNAK